MQILIWINKSFINNNKSVVYYVKSACFACTVSHSQTVTYLQFKKKFKCFHGIQLDWEEEYFLAEVCLVLGPLTHYTQFKLKAYN